MTWTIGPFTIRKGQSIGISLAWSDYPGIQVFQARNTQPLSFAPLYPSPGSLRIHNISFESGAIHASGYKYKFTLTHNDDGNMDNIPIVITGTRVG